MRWIPPGGDVVFDGDCGICTQTVRVLQWLDWADRLTFYSNSDPETFAMFPDLSIERAREEILVRDPRTGWYGGFQACEWIACRVPLLWFFIPLTLIPGAELLGQRMYNWTAQNRGKISTKLGLKACKINRQPPSKHK